MKAYWNALPKKKSIIISSISDFDKTLNLIENDGKISTRLGRTPYITFTKWTNKPERLFILSNGYLAIAFRNATDTDYIKVFDCDSGAYIADFANAGEYDINEIYSTSKDKEMTIFPSTYGDCLSVFSDDTYWFSSGHWGHSYLCVHNGRILAAKRDENYVNLYQEGDYLWENMRQFTFYIEGLKSPCTGLASFNGNLIYFSDYNTYLISIITTTTNDKDAGGNPIEIITDSATRNILFEDIGCISCYTIANVCGKLTWLSNEGVYQWDGKNTPKKISTISIERDIKDFNGKDLWTKPQGFSLNGKYYLTFCGQDLTGETFIYDGETGSWASSEYSTPIISFNVYEGLLLGLGIDAKIYNLNDENATESIDWFAEKEITKDVQKVKIIANGAINAKIIADTREIALKLNNDNSFIIPIYEINNAAKIILHIYGTGNVYIESIELIKNAGIS